MSADDKNNQPLSDQEMEQFLKATLPSKEEQVRGLGRTVGQYYLGLIDTGLDQQQALYLTVEMQKAMTRINKDA